MTINVFGPEGVAVITGAASGIGRAAAIEMARLGMKLCLFDTDDTKLSALAKELSTEIRVLAGDVSKADDIARLHDLAFEQFGAVTVLMNNAGIGKAHTMSSALADWARVIDVNLWGIINGCHRFAPSLLAQGKPSAIINTGSKQGITNPPGQPAYAISKAGVKILTEQLAHSFREAGAAHVTAHLLVPGFTFTGMTQGADQKPAGAWTPEQVVNRMIEGVTAGDFYIICPDNEVSPDMDRLRLAWSAGDMIENRPALSRWHPDWKARFEEFAAQKK